MSRYSSNAARKQAQSFWDQSRENLISARDLAYKKARELAKQAETLYPQIRKQLPDSAVINRRANELYNQARAGLRDTSASVGRSINNASASVGSGFRTAESWTMRLGVGYLLYKLFNSRKTQLNEVSDKVTAHINERPVESAVIALGVGYLLGKIIS